jgi:3-carboxy-cis,cis-muconate cycloisomerase
MTSAFSEALHCVGSPFATAACLGAMWRYHVALASTSESAQAIAAAAAELTHRAHHDAAWLEQLIHAGHDAGTLVVPAVAALKAQVGTEHASHVAAHSTSQDALDTAFALLAKPVVQSIVVDVKRCAQALARNARTQASTPMLARTLLQSASVTSLGWMQMQWALNIAKTAQALQMGAHAGLLLQWGGAAGAAGNLGRAAAEHAARTAQALGLQAAAYPTQCVRSDRTNMGLQAAALCQHLAKLGNDVALLAQFEVSEASEPHAAGQGASSAMPHKRNPARCMRLTALAHGASGLAAGLLSAQSAQQHQRSLGGWQAELALLADLLHASQSAAAIAADLCTFNGGIVWHTDRMLVNIQAVQAAVDVSTAQTWFDPALASEAALWVDRAQTELQVLIQ